MTRSIRTRLRRAIGLAVALGVVITPSALASATANPYSFYQPAVAATGSAPAAVSYYDAWHVPAPASQSVGTIATTRDTWGGDIRASRVGSVPPVAVPRFHGWGTVVGTSVTATKHPSAPSATITSSSSHETRNVLLAASGIGLLLIGGGSLVLMLRRRRAQLA